MAERLAIKNKRKASGRGGHHKHTAMHSSYHSTWDHEKKGKGNNTAARKGTKPVVVQVTWGLYFVPPTEEKLRIHPAATGSYKWKKAEA